MPRALPVIDLTAPICCAPVAAGRMGEAEALEVALRLKALADPTRVRLMSMLLTEGELCTCDLAAEVGLSDATVSHHLAQLRKAGLAEGARRGMNVWYRARPESLGALGRVLDPGSQIGTASGSCPVTA
ncbi:Rv2640c family ArsR-like transcriptional regulator [Pseudonocardia petroleophila]|uniref:Winged helix-turn-helix transcriptional regulator n=1 Tax=Pseudonocardia petroleophila TaxID=37331 RepID=A0A7G7ML60_9PSEU|nr:Rv2640c family ArsR-like transcriptional regulator [Pseudonocardia petroleophila]QNG53521.1 winged helix-turn-helix transcriptional regulator [Pseudonocardia petroleophila]